MKKSLVISKWQLVIRALSILFLITIYYLPFTNLSKAQVSPELMITWKAGNYVPPDYPGKVLPVGGAKIDVALELIDGGKLADLSRVEIRWLINGNTQRSGRGLKTTSFNADLFRGDQVVDITLPNYRGQNIVGRVIIPLTAPEVAIVGGSEIFQTIPYFFNISRPSDAGYIWTANGVGVIGAGDNPDIINLDLKDVPIGGSVDLSVMVQNFANPLEIADKTIQFIK